jgi:uncharacterized protein with HEPN domain
MGNRLRHEYHDVQLAIIWEIITDDLAPLRDACRSALQAGDNDGGD